MTHDLTPAEHEHSAAVEQAAQWLAEQNPEPSPALPVIREKFGLSPLEGCEVLAMARRFRTNRRAFG